MSRRIKLTDYPMAHPPVLEWLTANGLDTSKLPYDQVVEVNDATIRVTEFVFNPNGSKKVTSEGAVTEQFFATLISAPENHGL